MITIQDQTKLEQSMVDGGIARFNSALNKMMEKGIESATKHGRAIISTHIDEVAEGIDEIKNSSRNNKSIAKRKLKNLDSKVAAYISILALVDTLSRKSSFLKLATNIGMRIEDQVRLDHWVTEEKRKSEQKGKKAKYIIKKANQKTSSGRHSKRYGLTHKMNEDGYKDFAWTDEDRKNTGKTLIKIIREKTGLIDKPTYMKLGKKNSSMCVVPNAKTLNYIMEFNAKAEVARPRYVPTIIPPKDWTRVWGGGYYATVINNLPLIRIH